jgi:hypothetical protein
VQQGWGTYHGDGKDTLPQPLITRSESYLRGTRAPRWGTKELREARNVEGRRLEKLGSGSSAKSRINVPN